MLSEIEISTLHEIGYTVGYIVTAAIGTYTAWTAKKAKENSEQINDAVNHRHEKAGPNAPKLYDAIISLHEHGERMDKKADELLEWKRTYDGGPLDTGHKVIEFVDSVKALKENVDSLTKHCKGEDCNGRDCTGS